MAEKRELQMKEITEQLEQGVKELFTSEMYTEYLRTMSQFHNYSFNNTLLIAMQKPDATLVAGYQAWQKKFKRQVRRGEKAIQIIAPAPIREKQEVEKIDPETQEPVLRFDGQPETEEVEIVIPRFRVASVFDISQTDGEPLPELETPELMGSVENFKVFMKAVQEVSPVPVRFDEISSGAKGYYSNTIKKMAKDIHDKYVDPPFTTDFAILFLPFESIYAEVIRRTALVEMLQKEYKIVITGPTTLGAILNSLQMGFRTLAIQKRTGEVWTVLGAVKTEFSKFGGLLEKVQKNLQSAGDQLEEVMGKRTRAIERKLRQVEQLPHEESQKILPIDDGEDE